MSCTQQRGSVVQALVNEPYRFEFFQAVRLMVEWLAQQGIAPERALTEHVLFENILSFTFAPAQIAALSIDADPAPQVRITPAFMGFLGVDGTLPAHYTETIYTYQSTTHDEAPRAFLDMFSNRTLAQFYLAWRKHRVEHADAFLPQLLSFAGFQPGAAMAAGGAIDDETIVQYAGVPVAAPGAARGAGARAVRCPALAARDRRIGRLLDRPRRAGTVRARPAERRPGLQHPAG